MDQKPIGVDIRTVEYYLNRLIQRAIAEPKPLLKIYEEECQRHSDISITITFKEFQTALQKHCMTMQSRNQQSAAFEAKYMELNRYLKQQPGAFTSIGDMIDQPGRRRKNDASQNQLYHRMPSPAERFSPQAPNVNHRNHINHRFPAHNIKTEAGTSVQPSQYASPPAVGMPPPTVSNRPPSIQPPVEEEPPPEFIEMSSQPPRLSSEAQFSGLGVFAGPSNGVSITPVNVKPEPKDNTIIDKSNSAVAVQSSSSLDKSTSVLNDENLSPLNVRCVKCITALVTCAVMPCGHCCLCSICGQTVLSLKQVCPVCRKSVTTVIGYSNLIYNVYR